MSEFVLVLVASAAITLALLVGVIMAETGHPSAPTTNRGMAIFFSIGISLALVDVLLIEWIANRVFGS